MEENQTNGLVLFIQEMISAAFKNIVWLALMFVIIVGAGLGIALNAKPYHVAYATVSVSAVIDENELAYNDTLLAQEYVDEICELSQETVFVDRVRAKYGGEINEKKISAICTNTDKSLLITFTYEDSSEGQAGAKLKTLVEVMMDFLENGSYFNAHVTVVPIKSVEIDGKEGDIVSKTVEESDAKKILLLSGVLAIAVCGLYLLIKVKTCNYVFNEEKLESACELKTLATIDKLNAKKQNTNKVLEQTERLSNALIVKQIETGDKVYQIQSTAEGEGKSGVMFDLARCLAFSHKKVLVIDSDLVNPNVHKSFGVHIDNGLVEYCFEDKTFDKVIKPTSSNGLEVITAGKGKASTTAILSSNRFDELLTVAKAKYDFIFIDTSAVSSSPDYIQVSKKVDATLLVANKQKKNINLVVETINELADYNANVIGTVITC